jgi:hypothetical protein
MLGKALYNCAIQSAAYKGHYDIVELLNAHVAKTDR